MLEQEQRGSADRLENIIQAILMSRQTGIIAVERSKGGVRENGDITFLEGHIVSATAAGRSGLDALNWLRNWGSCRYVFTYKHPSEIVPPLPEPESASANETARRFPFVNLPKISKAFNDLTHARSTEVQEAVEKLEQEAQNTVPMQVVTQSTLSNTNSILPLVSDTAPQVQAPSLSSTNPSFPVLPGSARPTPVPPTLVPPTPVPLTPIQAPYRLLQGPDALAMMESIGVSRLHRHIFFLLDGHRTAHDLARLTRHSLNEVRQMLVDLEQMGLVKLPREW